MSPLIGPLFLLIWRGSFSSLYSSARLAMSLKTASAPMTLILLAWKRCGDMVSPPNLAWRQAAAVPDMSSDDVDRSTQPGQPTTGT